MSLRALSRLSLVVLPGLAVLNLAAPAAADDTGFAYIHDQRREAGRLCLSNHWHYGNGNGRSRKAAEASAIRSWADFTALEYGSDWARYSRARSKKMSCTQSGDWSCAVEARPCK